MCMCGAVLLVQGSKKKKKTEKKNKVKWMKRERKRKRKGKGRNVSGISFSFSTTLLWRLPFSFVIIFLLLPFNYLFLSTISLFPTFSSFFPPFCCFNGLTFIASFTHVTVVEELSFEERLTVSINILFFFSLVLSVTTPEFEEGKVKKKKSNTN